MLNLLLALCAVERRFKNCYSLHNVKASGESVCADVKAAKEFWETLDKLILKENYLPEEIFDMDENSLFWKGFSSVRRPS